MRVHASVDEYLASVSSDFRPALEALRAVIRDELPDAVECISYGIPTFKVGNKGIVFYAAFNKHCTFFTGTVHAEFVDQLDGFKTTKGGIHFLPDHMIPEPLVRAIVRACVAKAQAGQR